MKLIKGECLQEMDKLISDGIKVDMILCDLPFGKTAMKWDDVIPSKELWKRYEKLISDIGAIVLFGIEPFSSQLRMSNLPLYKYDWIWKKESGTGANHSKNMPLRDFENISVFSKGSIGHQHLIKNRMIYNPQGLKPCDKIQKHGHWGMEGTMERKSQTNAVKVYFENYPKMVLEYKRDGKPKLHPTQKPVALLEYLIYTYSDENNLILDNCMGSGSTGVACRNSNRDFIGIELDEKYFEIAQNRILKCS